MHVLDESSKTAEIRDEHDDYLDINNIFGTTK
jgi:hypothetical protein